MGMEEFKKIFGGEQKKENPEKAALFAAVQSQVISQIDMDTAINPEMQKHLRDHLSALTLHDFVSHCLDNSRDSIYASLHGEKMSEREKMLRFFSRVISVSEYYDMQGEQRERLHRLIERIERSSIDQR